MKAEDILFGQNWVQQMQVSVREQRNRLLEDNIARLRMDATWVGFCWDETPQGAEVWRRRDRKFGGSYCSIITR